MCDWMNRENVLHYNLIGSFYRKSVFKARQHMIHLNLAIALLLGLIVFVSGIETASGNRVSQTTSYIAVISDLYLNLYIYIVVIIYVHIDCSIRIFCMCSV